MEKGALPDGCVAQPIGIEVPAPPSLCWAGRVGQSERGGCGRYLLAHVRHHPIRRGFSGRRTCGFANGNRGPALTLLDGEPIEGDGDGYSRRRVWETDVAPNQWALRAPPHLGEDEPITKGRYGRRTCRPNQWAQRHRPTWVRVNQSGRGLAGEVTIARIQSESGAAKTDVGADQLALRTRPTLLPMNQQKAVGMF